VPVSFPPSRRTNRNKTRLRSDRTVRRTGVHVRRDHAEPAKPINRARFNRPSRRLVILVGRTVSCCWFFVFIVPRRRRRVFNSERRRESRFSRAVRRRRQSSTDTRARAHGSGTFRMYPMTFALHRSRACATTNKRARVATAVRWLSTTVCRMRRRFGDGLGVRFAGTRDNDVT